MVTSWAYATVFITLNHDVYTTQNTSKCRVCEQTVALFLHVPIIAWFMSCAMWDQLLFGTSQCSERIPKRVSSDKSSFHPPNQTFKHNISGWGKDSIALTANHVLFVWQSVCFQPQSCLFDHYLRPKHIVQKSMGPP